jgi:RNA polymerase sigma-70 factor (ECF subfamily)
MTLPERDRPLAVRFATDPDSLDDCYRTLGPMVLAYLTRLVGRADAEDVLQQVFVEAWRNRERFDPERRLEPWLLDIARKRAIDQLRRDERNRRDATAALEQAIAIDNETFAQRYVDAVAVRAALATLSPAEREVLVLAYFAELSQSEIAARLQLPLGTVKARAFRGLRHLSRQLSEPESSAQLSTSPDDERGPT